MRVFPCLLGLGAALVFIGSGLFLAAPAAAHAVLLSMAPANGSLVMVAPTRVVLTFDSQVQVYAGDVIVVGPDGTHAETGSPVATNNVVTATLRPIKVPGRYLVAYRVASADGFPVSQELWFDYVIRPAFTATSAVPTDQRAGPPVALYAVVAAVGVVVFGLLARRRSRRVERAEPSPATALGSSPTPTEPAESARHRTSSGEEGVS